jgi:putative copper export protein
VGDVTIARAIHVLSIVHWIGGLAFVTLVVLPLCRRTGIGLFEEVERQFSRQVKVSVLLAGASGFYMVERLDLWPRFLDPASWWLAAMAILWLLFMVVLFVVEPSARDRVPELRFLARAHQVLLAVSSLVVAAAVLGAHGLLG